MAEAIFLSAGVPDPKRGPEYAATADVVAITAAVSALVHVTLGRRQLVWGGHPAISPMIWVVAQEMGIEYGRWVRLYQSRFFQDEFPEDNDRFQNVIYTPNVPEDREKSLLLMREQMFSENQFKAGVFIGGMAGIVDEFELFSRLQPNAAVVPVVSAGGAALQVAERIGVIAPDLRDDLDYVALFHRYLGISVREERFQSPEDQPADVVQRYWNPPTVRT
ncbi:hypothetical protein Pcar_2915 [Syntrophotalea carbinolica DSM 2380]|uniref:Uncharacterized protein n=1 Tax=Syntrophotalea carbinolica (strain DSM 2380 / NBRC 103641 / GraBd1) TaxID=338963 RepID=Q3A0F7_SYNC1|nr:hypothetical protein [Syntrophotalea carbinolica]ABA90150.2 hypothetical protein Pcar_2915 [Syntrophotalea carbinolica DSM 2380]